MLVTGTENSPTKSLDDVESKSFIQNRSMATSGQCSWKLKFSFQVGLKPGRERLGGWPLCSTVVFDGPRLQLLLVLGHSEYLDGHVRIDDVLARLALRQILGTDDAHPEGDLWPEDAPRILTFQQNLGLQHVAAIAVDPEQTRVQVQFLKLDGPLGRRGQYLSGSLHVHGDALYPAEPRDNRVHVR